MEHEFLKRFNLTEGQFDGSEEISGWFDLSSLTSIPEGFNPTVGCGLDLSGLTSIPEGFNPTVGCGLYLRSLTSIPEGFNPTVGGGLYLSSLTSIPEGFNPTVGGGLNLRSLTSIPEGFNPTVGDSLNLRSLTSIPEGFNPTVGGFLDLSSLTSIPEGFNPTVGGWLDLRSLTSIPEGFNPTVGDSLNLRSLTSIPEGFNPTVGGFLDLSSLTSIPEGFNPTVGGSLDLRRGLHCETKDPPPVIEWATGYCIADGMFGKILSRRESGTQVIWKLKKVSQDKTFILVEQDGYTAHGKSIRDAIIDLLFKMEDRDKYDYEHLELDSVLRFEDAVICYRVITGACSFGVSDFLENRLKERKEEYTVNEIIELTGGEYGGDSFADFFAAGCES